MFFATCGSSVYLVVAEFSICVLTAPHDEWANGDSVGDYSMGPLVES